MGPLRAVFLILGRELRSRRRRRAVWGLRRQTVFFGALALTGMLLLRAADKAAWVAALAPARPRDWIAMVGVLWLLAAAANATTRAGELLSREDQRGTLALLGLTTLSRTGLALGFATAASWPAWQASLALLPLSLIMVGLGLGRIEQLPVLAGALSGLVLAGALLGLSDALTRKHKGRSGGAGALMPMLLVVMNFTGFRVGGLWYPAGELGYAFDPLRAIQEARALGVWATLAWSPLLVWGLASGRRSLERLVTTREPLRGAQRVVGRSYTRPAWLPDPLGPWQRRWQRAKGWLWWGLDWSGLLCMQFGLIGAVAAPVNIQDHRTQGIALALAYLLQSLGMAWLIFKGIEGSDRPARRGRGAARVKADASEEEAADAAPVERPARPPARQLLDPQAQLARPEGPPLARPVWDRAMLWRVFKTRSDHQIPSRLGPLVWAGIGVAVQYWVAGPISWVLAQMFLLFSLGSAGGTAVWNFLHPDRYPLMVLTDVRRQRVWETLLVDGLRRTTPALVFSAFAWRQVLVFHGGDSLGWPAQILRIALATGWTLTALALGGGAAVRGVLSTPAERRRDLRSLALAVLAAVLGGVLLWWVDGLELVYAGLIPLISGRVAQPWGWLWLGPSWGALLCGLWWLRRMPGGLVPENPRSRARDRAEERIADGL